MVFLFQDSLRYWAILYFKPYQVISESDHYYIKWGVRYAVIGDIKKCQHYFMLKSSTWDHIWSRKEDVSGIKHFYWVPLYGTIMVLKTSIFCSITKASWFINNQYLIISGTEYIFVLFPFMPFSFHQCLQGDKASDRMSFTVALDWHWIWYRSPGGVFVRRRICPGDPSNSQAALQHWWFNDTKAFRCQWFSSITWTIDMYKKLKNIQKALGLEY